MAEYSGDQYEARLRDFCTVWDIGPLAALGRLIHEWRADRRAPQEEATAGGLCPRCGAGARVRADGTVGRCLHCGEPGDAPGPCRGQTGTNAAHEPAYRLATAPQGEPEWHPLAEAALASLDARKDEDPVEWAARLGRDINESALRDPPTVTNAPQGAEVEALVAQVNEAIAILDSGTDYERLHVSAILRNGLATLRAKGGA